MTASTVKQARPLLDLIGSKEAPKGYDQVWGGIKSRDHPPRPVTTMTIGQVLAWQDSIDHLYRSEAAGRYQFMEDTLRDIYAPAGFTLRDPFNEATQDALACHLLKRRGLKQYLRGEIDINQFGNNIAREWASFPVFTGPKRGRSYYAGDGLNHSYVKIGEVMAAIKAMGVQRLPDAPMPDHAPSRPKTPDNPLMALWRAFWAAITKGRKT